MPQGQTNLPCAINLTIYSSLIAGIASIDVAFDLCYIYLSVEVFEGESGFLATFFPLVGSIMKVNDAYAKRIRRYCGLKYTFLTVNYDARQAKVRIRQRVGNKNP